MRDQGSDVLFHKGIYLPTRLSREKGFLVANSGRMGHAPVLTAIITAFTTGYGSAGLTAAAQCSQDVLPALDLLIFLSQSGRALSDDEFQICLLAFLIVNPNLQYVHPAKDQQPIVWSLYPCETIHVWNS